MYVLLTFLYCSLHQKCYLDINYVYFEYFKLRLKAKIVRVAIHRPQLFIAMLFTHTWCTTTCPYVCVGTHERVERKWAIRARAPRMMIVIPNGYQTRALTTHSHTQSCQRVPHYGVALRTISLSACAHTIFWRFAAILSLFPGGRPRATRSAGRNPR